MEGSAGSVGRIMAPLLGVPEAHHARLRAAWARVPAHQLRPRRPPRTTGWTASISRRRTASASATGGGGLRARERLAGAARARGARGPPAPAACSPPPARPSPPPPTRCARASGSPARSTVGVLDRVEALGYDVLGRRPRLPAWQLPLVALAALRPMTRRATLRGRRAHAARRARRRADLRRELRRAWRSRASWRGSGADVLVVDRYEIGERQTSACAIADAVARADGHPPRAIRQELACMSFHTPHGTARHRLPWSWTSFDYRTLCQELWEQCDARFEVAKVERRDGRHGASPTAAPLARAADRRRARLAPRARPGRQRPAARGAHLARARGPPARAAASTSTSGSTARSIRRGYAWSVPGRRRAAGRRRLLRAARPRQGADARDRRAALGVAAVRYQGNWFPHQLRPAAEDGVFFVGDSRRPLLPALRRGHPHRVLLRHRLRPRAARGARRRAHAASRRSPPTARSRAATRRAFAWALRAPARDPARCRRGCSRACSALVGRRRL